MRRGSLVMALGVTLLLLGFALGTWRPATSVDGATVSCPAVLDVARLPFSEAGPVRDRSARPATARERRTEVSCTSAQHPRQVGTWASLGFGGLVTVIAWTAIRERDATSGERRPA